jgi:hypothetical protein
MHIGKDYAGQIEGINMNERTLLPHLRLRFNINHPTLEECYCFGYESAEAEISEDDNPFNKGTEEHSQWLEGWWASFYGETPLFSTNHYQDNAEDLINKNAANDLHYQHDYSAFLVTFLKITSAIAATALVSYQVLDLVA